jgi:hypothetical protein
MDKDPPVTRPETKPAPNPRQARLEREAAALRANLLKRKERQRARDKPPAPDQAV